MCRNIKLLFHFQPPATDDEIRASALQYVRKVSGMNAPAAVNQEAFQRAVDRITDLTTVLLREELQTASAPRDRAVEAERARERGKKRDAALRKRLMAPQG